MPKTTHIKVKETTEITEELLDLKADLEDLEEQLTKEMDYSSHLEEQIMGARQMIFVLHKGLGELSPKTQKFHKQLIVDISEFCDAMIKQLSTKRLF